MSFSPKSDSYLKYSYLQQQTSQTEPNKSSLTNEGPSMLISQLKTKIFDLEQNNKNYDTLLGKFKNLQNENALLTQDKLRLEYQLKQKTDSSVKIITEIQNENESLKAQLKEKILTNKNLFNENNSLTRELNDKNNNLEFIEEQLKIKEENFHNLSNNLKQNEKEIFNLNQNLNKRENYILKLESDIKELKKVIEQKNELIESTDKSNILLHSKLEDLQNENQNLLVKLKNKENNLNQLQTQINNLNNSLKSLDTKNAEYNSSINRIQNELSLTSNNLSKERTIRNNCEQTIEDLETEIKNKMNEIKTANINNDNMKGVICKLTQDREKLILEIEKLQSHIMVLTEANKELTEELEAIVERDEKIGILLRRDEGLLATPGASQEKINNVKGTFNRTPPPDFH